MPRTEQDFQKLEKEIARLTREYKASTQLTATIKAQRNELAKFTRRAFMFVPMIEPMRNEWIEFQKNNTWVLR